MTRQSVKLLRSSPEIRNFIKGFEALRLKAYRDQKGVLTIGWGHTRDVHEGQVITRTQAEDLFRQDVYVAEGTLRLGVKVPLFQHEYDALLSFVFNVGGGNFAKSTMRELLNELRYEDAADQFPRWVYAGKEKSNGLIRRRDAERRIFLTGLYA